MDVYRLTGDRIDQGTIEETIEWISEITDEKNDTLSDMEYF